jgi:TonB-dependent starch-binding outer membrane protein SusC
MHAPSRRSWLSIAALGASLLGVPSPLPAQSTGVVAGRVTVDGGLRPLGSAQVVISGTLARTETNDAGAYRLVDVPAGSYEVRVQRLGFTPATKPVTVLAGETATLDFELREIALTLDQIVVTATGGVRRREVAHTLSTISAAEVQNAPMRNTQDLLNRSPGVTVLANSGQPGAGATIRLRGVNSISQGNNPIIYVDGVRIFSGSTPVVPNARQTTNPFNDINKDDIERVEIVKGAAATTLYGTEASGGVIQIFTKRGGAGPPQWTLDATAGTNDLRTMGPDGDPTGLFVKQCRGAELYAVDIVQFDAKNQPNPKFGTDVRFEDRTCPASGSWLRTGMIQRYAGSVRGGSEGMRYYLSGNLADEEGAISASEVKDGGFRGSFSFNPTPKVELALSSAFTKRTLQWVPDGNLANGFLLNVARGPNGNFKAGGCSSRADVCVHNGEMFRLDAFTRSDHFVTGFTLNYAPWAHFTNRFTVGYDYNNAQNQSIIELGHLRNPRGQILQGDWKRKFLSLDYAATLAHQFGGSLGSRLSWGGQLFQDALEQTNVQGDDFAASGPPTLVTAARRGVTLDLRPRVINAGFFVQGEAAWRDRLFVTAGLRVDGNSAFGEDFGLQAYPKLGVSYVLSDHPFWPSDTWETLKLRAAIGESGKAPGAFDAVRSWSPIAGDEGKPGVTPNQIGNPKLGPERTRELEFGFETSALAGRLGLDFTYFHTRTLKALIQVRYPPSDGFLERQLENLGELKTTGIEAAFQAGLVRLPHVDWRARLNYTAINSKAVDLGGQPEIAIGDQTVVRVGYPVPSFFTTKILNPNAFADPILTDRTVFAGATFPDKIVGVGSTLTVWGRLSLDALGEVQLGGTNVNYIGYQNALRGVWRACIPVQRKLAAAAKGDPAALNDVTARDRARCAIDRTKQNSAFWVEPTDFFKLRYVSLTYDIPPRYLRGVQFASVTVAGRNLYTATRYSGLDPESADLADADNTFARREYYQLPALRSFTASLRVRF